ncbi:hypothetical protein BDZ89DRAFT_1064881 [Hymenopellis radicata]|nr:hypothetical protein BDZ89DRAFT_1064881 [Hymenopellis radicata]
MSTSPGADASIMMQYKQKALSDEVDGAAILELLATITQVDGQIEPFLDVLRHWLSKAPSTVDDNTAHAQYFCLEALGASVLFWKKEAPWCMHVLAPIWADILLPWVGQYCALFTAPPKNGHAYLFSRADIYSYLCLVVRRVALDVLPMDSEGKSALVSVFAIKAIPIDIIKSAIWAYIHAAASSLDDASVFEVCSDMLEALRKSVAFGRDPRISQLWLEVLGESSRSLRTLCSQSMVRHLESGFERSDHVMTFVAFCGTGSRLWRRTFMAHDIVTDMISTTKQFLRSSARQDISPKDQLHGARCIEYLLGFVQALTSYEGLRGVMDVLKCNIIYFLLKCDASRGKFLIDNSPNDCHPAIDAIFGNIRKYMVHPGVLSSVSRARYHKSRPVPSKLVAACSPKIQFHWYSMMVKEAPVLEIAISDMLEKAPTFYRACANPEVMSNPHCTAPTKCCMACRQVFYHSEACQRSDWPNHRDACLLAAEQFLDGSSPSLSRHWTDYFHCFFRREVLYGPQSVECKRMWHAYLADHRDVFDAHDIMIVLDYSTNEKKIEMVPSIYLPSEFKEPSILMRWYIPWDSQDGLSRAWGEASFTLSKATGCDWNSE